ncbi:hypothetical protein ON010_g9590 [Phytophthora cinnamomi]|nr:hypothetical protein ON010_g9590 [Phytophthora cinnamomi]
MPTRVAARDWWVAIQSPWGAARAPPEPPNLAGAGCQPVEGRQSDPRSAPPCTGAPIHPTHWPRSAPTGSANTASSVAWPGATAVADRSSRHPSAKPNEAASLSPDRGQRRPHHYSTWILVDEALRSDRARVRSSAGCPLS